MVEKNYLEGAAERAGGKLEEAAGYVTGSPGARMEGRLRDVTGKAQQVYGRAAEGIARSSSHLQSAARNRPLPALLIALGVGFALGRMIGR